LYSLFFFFFLQVRGAPAIAIAAILSLAAECHSALLSLASTSPLSTPSLPTTDLTALTTALSGKLTHLKTSRPTAVNLANACDELSTQMSKWDKDTSVEAALKRVIAIGEELWRKDVADNITMGKFGAEAVLNATKKSKVCNAVQEWSNTFLPLLQILQVSLFLFD
jgi:methylthioribose-1-phosphate isomerase